MPRTRGVRSWALGALVIAALAPPDRAGAQPRDGGAPPPSESQGDEDASPDQGESPDEGEGPGKAGKEGESVPAGGDEEAEAGDEAPPAEERKADEGGDTGARAADETDEKAGEEARAPGDAEGADPTEEQRAQARELYARGETLYEQGRFREAIEAFKKAYETIADPIVLLGIAKSLESAGEIPDAIEALQLYLQERPDAPDKASVRKRLAELRSTPATVEVTSEPPKAHILVDGEPTDATTPAELEISPGQHTVELKIEGYKRVSRAIELPPAGHRKLEVQLEEKPEPPPATEREAFGQQKGLEEPDDGEETAAAEGEKGVHTGVWVSAGVAASGLVAGTVLGFLALSQESDFQRMPTEETADDGERLALFADVAFGVAAAAGITGLVLHLTRGRRADDTTQESSDGADQARLGITPVAGPQGGGVEAHVRF